VLPLVIGLEVVIWLAGLIALRRVVVARRVFASPSLAPWPVTVEGFSLGVLLTVGGAMALPYAITHLGDNWLGSAARDGAWWQAVQAAAFQLGLLAGLLIAALYLHLNKAGRFSALAAAPEVFRPEPTRYPVVAGVTVFLISIPVINGIGFFWKTLVEALGFSAAEQDMVGLFRDCDDPERWLFMVALATVIAPLTEELVFRAGLFRFLRSRLPRGLALIIPAVVFALLHGNLVAVVPLCALGAFFAIAYEQTGRISVPIIAHALFNLHTILLVMAGVT
jgi:membrane protease YdiL (CAAX protease family)